MAKAPPFKGKSASPAPPAPKAVPKGSFGAPVGPNPAFPPQAANIKPQIGQGSGAAPGPKPVANAPGAKFQSKMGLSGSGSSKFKGKKK